MIPKPLTLITSSDIDALAAAQRPEGRRIDYKLVLPAKGDDDRKAFLLDVAAFANTHGGDLIYGVNEQDGLPVDVPGLDVRRDAEQLRLEQMIRGGIEPKIPRIALGWVEMPSTSRSVLIVRVPRSWTGPHMVVAGNRQLIHARGERGNHPMDISELRAAFRMAGDIGASWASFRDERIRAINSGTGYQTPRFAKMILHVVPISSLVDPRSIDTTLGALPTLLCGRSPEYRRHNVDGHLASDPKLGYVLLLRSGAIEAVDTWFAESEILPSRTIEKQFVSLIPEYISALRTEHELEPPYLVGLSLIGVTGKRMAADRWIVPGSEERAFDRQLIVLPEVLIDIEDDRPWSLRLRPLIDMLWQASGRSGSENFDRFGKWLVDLDG